MSNIEVCGEFHASEYPTLLREIGMMQEKCNILNQTSIMEFEKRSGMLNEIFGSLGENAWVVAPFHCALGKNITVGKNVLLNFNCGILDVAKVTIGDNCVIAPNCAFYTSGHAVEPAKRLDGWQHAYPITIEENVWVGGNVTVVSKGPKGITIGKNSVIGAGSLVLDDIPANVLACGNPAKVVRKLD